jgi:hypothetical protein
MWGNYIERKKHIWSGYGFPQEVTELQRYAALIRSYTSRELTNMDDSLNAIQGILRDFGSTIDGYDNNFIYGLPDVVFDYALWWKNEYVPLMSKRRKNFPSWSWAGWSGNVSYNLGTCFSRREFQPSSKACEIFFFGPENEESNCSCVILISDQETEDRPPWKPEGASILPISVRNVDPLTAPHLIRFWTSSAFLPVDLHETEPGTGCFMIHSYALSITIMLDTSWRIHQPLHLEFIVVARESGLSTICIAWTGEVAYRVGRPSRTIYEDEWMKHNPTWKFIALG